MGDPEKDKHTADTPSGADEPAPDPDVEELETGTLPEQHSGPLDVVGDDGGY